MKTAVEQLEKQILDNWMGILTGKVNIDELLDQAKEMEEEQIKDAFDNGWQRANDTKDKSYITAEDYGFNYYKQTFKTE